MSLPNSDSPRLERDGADKGVERRTGPHTMMARSSSGNSCKTRGEGRGCSTSVDGATEGEATVELGGGDSKKSSCDNKVGWGLGEGEGRLGEDDMSRDDDTSSRQVKTAIPLMRGGIPPKHTSNGARCEFVGCRDR
jgi:hypothetical protein